MKNRKGFTLIELIAVIVILGLIIMIAVPFFQGSLDTFREDYYKSLEDSVLNSARDFFSDNRVFLPNRYLDTQKINVDTLITKKYLDDVKDYNGNSCDLLNSYVIIAKEGKEKYEYALCMRCEDDDYVNIDNPYCSEAWDSDKGFTEIAFDAASDVAVHRGIDRSKLKEQVKVFPTIKRCSGDPNANPRVCNKIVKEVSGNGDLGVSPIYPLDLDKVDKDTVGVYEVNYRYDLKDENNIIRGRVIVFEDTVNVPNGCGDGTGTSDIKITKNNKIYSTTSDNLGVPNDKANSSTPYNATTANEWAQWMTFEFSHAFPSSVLSAYPGNELYVARYQWFKNNRWEDICIPGTTSEGTSDSLQNYCKKTVNTPMNIDIKFRYIDSLGNASVESSLCKIRIEDDEPEPCTIKLTGSKGTNEWYNGDVTVEIDNKKDVERLNSPYNGAPVVMSGIPNTPGVAYGVSKLKKVDIKNPDYQRDDAQSVTWYGYVEDYAKKYSTCSITFKKDATKPVCTITENTKLTCTDPTSGLVRVTFSKTANDTTSASLAISPNPKTDEWTTTGNATEKGVWYLRAVDDAGNVQQISDTYYLITYDANGGNGVSMASAVVRKNVNADLTPTATKNGYEFVGWNTNKNATKKLNSHKVTADKTLYAIYKECADGYYSNNSTTCTPCPSGYQAGTALENKTSESNCIRSVAAGKYLKTAKGTDNTECDDGYYKAAHYVKYGNTSSCTQCPEGYRNGTDINNKKSQSVCLRNVAAGRYIKNAKDTSNTLCAKGTYKGAHSVTYGNTSSCTSCPSGKSTSGTGATSSSDCNVDCGPTLVCVCCTGGGDYCAEDGGCPSYVPAHTGNYNCWSYNSSC